MRRLAWRPVRRNFKQRSATQRIANNSNTSPFAQDLTPHSVEETSCYRMVIFDKVGFGRPNILTPVYEVNNLPSLNSIDFN